eukprot:TRINITY_DN64389_c0_g1_i1.p1 TRINITY_DN64389_c0_g1~~TRINITY_DN64389_c0_g1_i1.p1  ORF type:complete len:215 (+),score=45.62 TRINITY_DN64389_c0_g1_i1:184-828(+)
MALGESRLRRRLSGLYRGVVPAAAASAAFRTVPFVGYEFVSRALRDRSLLQGSPLLAAFVAGAAGGVMRGCLETPAELVKIRLQTRRAWRSSSVAGAFRGLGSTCLRNACVIGCYWSIFEATKPVRVQLPPALGNFLGGGVCSVGAWALIYPLDTAKSRIQASQEKTRGTLGEVRQIVSSRGVGGLYRGIGAGLLRAFLANGAGMVAYGWFLSS